MHNNLTSRELEVLKAIASGLTIKAGACSIGIAYATFQKHQNSMYKKMSFHYNIQAVHYALHHNLVNNIYNPKQTT